MKLTKYCSYTVYIKILFPNLFPLLVKENRFLYADTLNLVMLLAVFTFSFIF